MKEGEGIGSDVPGTGATMNFLQRLGGIYFEPTRTFEDVRARGSWIGVFLIVSVLFAATTYAVTTRFDSPTLVRKSLEKNPFTRNMSEEQIEQIASRPVGPIQRYAGIFFAPVGVLVGYLVTAGVLFLVFTLMGHSLGFKKSLAVTVWGMGPPTIILMALCLVFVLLKDPETLDIFNVANNVVSNPSGLVDEKESPMLNGLLGSIDLFSAWAIYLLSVGFAVVSDGRLTVQKAALGILIPWAVYVAGKIAFIALIT